jgi:uncharacterized RDD family membrane protein YckC
MTGQQVVVTPEKVVLTYNIASLGSRIGAKLIDLMVLYVVMTGASILLAFMPALFEGLSDVIIGAFFLVSTFAIFLYFILQEVFMNGQTLGKKAIGLRVMSVDGTPVTPLSAFYRNLVMVADLALPFIGLTMMFLGERGQRVGDLAAGTIVVHEPRADLRFLPSPHRYGIHPLEEHVGSLKGMTLEEYLAIKRLCDRFPDLPPAIQDRSIQEIWTPFATRFKIPQVPNVHPIYMMEATVMKYGRMRNLV